ncbi:MAG: hypothetical protein HWE22_20425 [Flavobacteriales bacterium]|nr:hypothetical protein [Flavobacteriales bacterium]
MAEYSEEYWAKVAGREPKKVKSSTLLDTTLMQGKSLVKGDFSFYDEFKQLKEGNTMQLTCEGFGTQGIGVFDGQYVVLMIDGSDKTLDDLLNG